MKKQLLREWYAIEYTPQAINESRESNSGKIVLPAVLQKAHTKNQNGRIYPSEVLRREVQNYEKVVRENRALGELDHPETSTVALDRASHIVREIYWEGDTVRGLVEILNTPKGKILEQLLESGVRIGMSSRGVGSTEATNEGTDIVQDDYQLICFDAVSEPSTPGAFMNESKMVEVSDKIWTKADRIYRALNDIKR
jgi:hypothetical protein